MNENQTYLARAYTLKDLPGRLRKYLEVSPGRRGITISSNGEIQTFGPGRRRVMSGSERLLSRGAACRAGIIPGGSFTARVKAENLLSGDDELLDASLLCEVEIIDPARFFTRQVLPRQVIRGNSLDLSSESGWELLGALVRRYAAADLVHGAPTERMLPQIRAGLGPLLMDQGLQLGNIQLLTFWRIEDRALAAEKALAFQDRLRDVELEAKMAQIETEAQFDDFVHQLEPDMEEKIGLHPVEIEDTDAAAEGEGKFISILDSFRTWINFESKKDERGRHFRIDGLFRRLGKEKEAPAKGRRRPERWWLPRVIWMGFVIVAAYGVTRLVNWIAGAAESGARWEFYLTIWGFAAIVIFESLRSLFQKREEFEEVHWAEPGATFVDDLVGQDRVQADGLIRNQCDSDLHNTQDMLNNLRSRAYKNGAEELALQIRSLEKKFHRTREDAMNPNIGVPPYVTDLKVSRRMWDDLLDYDEQLLVRASAVSEDVQALQQEYAQGAEITPEKLNQLEGRLDAFLHNFKNRNQALRAPDEQKDQYRL